MPVFLKQPGQSALATQRQREAIVAALPATAEELAVRIGTTASMARNRLITLARERAVEVVGRKLSERGRTVFVYGQRAQR